jgi:hypothetical protein
VEAAVGQTWFNLTVAIWNHTRSKISQNYTQLRVQAHTCTYTCVCKLKRPE